MQGIFSILEQCNRVYMPILKDAISQMKVRRYEQMLDRLQMEKIKRNTHQCVMPEKVEEYAKIRAKEEC